MIAPVDALKLLGALIAIVGSPVALATYYRSARTKRAEWLSSLHEKFFESKRYDSVRRILDYRPEPEYSELVNAVRSETHSATADELYRYLNFFELLAGLRGLGQISDVEIKRLFDYDIKLINKHDFLVNALEPQGFEQLARLIVSIPRIRER